MIVNDDGFPDKEGLDVVNWNVQEEFYRPRYDFDLKKWVETASKEEIVEINTPKQIDISSEVKNNESLTKENEQLWDTVEYLLKQVNMIPEE